jgi:putative transposase
MNDSLSGSFRRKTLRWTSFDYQTPAIYFVTICTAGRRPLLGQVDQTGRLHPSRIGLHVIDAWYTLPDRFPSLDLIAFVAMPDHVHGVLEIGPVTDDRPKLTPGQVISTFKSVANHVTRQLDERAGRSGSMWQQGYHDRVVRSDDELRQFEWYITENPARWAVSRMVVGEVDAAGDRA